MSKSHKKMPPFLKARAFIMIYVVFTAASFAQIAKQRDWGSIHAEPLPAYALLNVNNLTSWLHADGRTSYFAGNYNSAYFPRGTGNVIYCDGILWGGNPYLDSARTQLAHNFPLPFRIGGATYNSSTRPGRIIGFGANAVPADPNAPASRIYRIRRDYFLCRKKFYGRMPQKSMASNLSW